MVLTGKAKKDFLTNMSILTEIKDKKDLEEYFSKISDLIKNAYYVDFFDSVKIHVNAVRYSGEFWKGIAEHERTEIHLSRQEAITEAIKKANEIYNSK